MSDDRAPAQQPDREQHPYDTEHRVRHDARPDERADVPPGAEHEAGPGHAPFALVDVFGAEPLTGNPLAVVDLTAYARRTGADVDEGVDAGAGEGAAVDVDEEWLRRVAREMNQSETTFVLPGTHGAVRDLRSFTAGGVEVTGAGHNALGAWWWLLHTGRVTPAPAADGGAATLVQRIGGRNLDVLVAGDGHGGHSGELTMRQAPARLGTVVDAPERLAELAAAIGLAPGDLVTAPAPRTVDTGAAHLMVLVRERAALERAVPDKRRLTAAADTAGAQGVYVVRPDGTPAVARPGRTAHARFFNPGVGLDEDPATGSAAGPLAAYLRAAGLLATGEELTVVQGEAMGRPSTLRVTVDAGGAPRVTGGGSLTVEGRLSLASLRAGRG